MRILSWNINSVRLRLSQLERLVRRYRPDVICLQETKVEDALFPRSFFEELDLGHIALSGQKTHHGVAVLSRLPFRLARAKRWCGRREHRHLYVSLPRGTEIHNLYVPAGGPTPNPLTNPAFAYKLRFLGAVARWFRRRPIPVAGAILVGDLNVAPHPNDVWSHERLRNVVTHTDREVAALARLRRSGRWVDAVRHFVPETRKLFTWWSYRNPNWRLSDKGRRLDHAWVSPVIESRLVSVRILRETRSWKPPSDHVPVLLEVRSPPTRGA